MEQKEYYSGRYPWGENVLTQYGRRAVIFGEILAGAGALVYAIGKYISKDF